jgi:ABC-type multidrug transport system ATPase subunit
MLLHIGNVSIDGEIIANGIPVGKFMGQVSGYVYQTDLFCGTLTVSEHLNFMVKQPYFCFDTSVLSDLRFKMYPV